MTERVRFGLARNFILAILLGLIAITSPNNDPKFATYNEVSSFLYKTWPYLVAFAYGSLGLHTIVLLLTRHKG
jgi:hypothetical protein